MTTLTLRDLGFVAAGQAAVSGYDSDAQTYITAVEAADGQSLETAVKDAINTFVVGCKADGIWSAIKSSCILAGARTLAGALVPLVGTAPTNNNFVSADYNRKTGLIGNGSTKYLNSNRAGNADPQNSAHAAVYRTDSGDPGLGSYFGSAKSGVDQPRNVTAYTYNAFLGFACRKSGAGDPYGSISATAIGFIGVARSSSTDHTHRANGSSTTTAINSIAPDATGVYIFANNNAGVLATPTTARLAFYSIGESLNLSQLDGRVTTLITALATAIP